MKHREFSYLKEGGQIKRYAVLVMNETDQDFSGISLGDLPQPDQQKIIEATRAYELALEPYFKAHFRKFKKGLVVDLLKETK